MAQMAHDFLLEGGYRFYRHQRHRAGACGTSLVNTTTPLSTACGVARCARPFAPTPGPDHTTRRRNVGEAAAHAVEKLGFTGLKFDPFRDEYMDISHDGLAHAIACIQAAREAIGTRADIAVDGHWRFGPQAAIRIARALEPFDLMFLEEPVPSDANEMLARVRAEVNVPLATGERYYTRWGFWPLLRDRLGRCDPA